MMRKPEVMGLCELAGYQRWVKRGVVESRKCGAEPVRQAGSVAFTTEHTETTEKATNGKCPKLSPCSMVNALTASGSFPPEKGLR